MPVAVDDGVREPLADLFRRMVRAHLAPPPTHEVRFRLSVCSQHSPSQIPADSLFRVQSTGAKLPLGRLQGVGAGAHASQGEGPMDVKPLVKGLLARNREVMESTMADVEDT